MSTLSVFGPPIKDRTGVAKTWNPRKPCDIFNPLPQDKWPRRFNEKVFFISRYGGIATGRIAWYHPARIIDRSSCITPGKPFYNIRYEDSSFLISSEDVFPGTKKGFIDARAKVVDGLMKAIAQEKIDSARRITGLEEEIRREVKMEMPT